MGDRKKRGCGCGRTSKRKILAEKRRRNRDEAERKRLLEKIKEQKERKIDE